MNKRKVKIIVVAIVAVVITAVLCAVGMANNVTDGMFNMNTPTKITKNSTVIGTIESTDDYQNLVGKYTFRNSDQNYNDTKVYYIAAVNGNSMIYRQLSNGETITFSNASIQDINDADVDPEDTIGES